ncbi:hypothetical protein ABK905_25990 [Acerihabitans sp. KWT182]|uniref:Spore coat protein U domain-containing protein n=1 Tax=Acerihabitans sp. KWT182 TaxID=3157919 RepID=A0AAU7Q919_9GAMM
MKRKLPSAWLKLRFFRRRSLRSAAMGRLARSAWLMLRIVRPRRGLRFPAAGRLSRSGWMITGIVRRRLRNAGVKRLTSAALIMLCIVLCRNAHGACQLPPSAASLGTVTSFTVNSSVSSVSGNINLNCGSGSTLTLLGG